MHEFGLSQVAEEGGENKVLDPVVNVTSEGSKAQGEMDKERARPERKRLAVSMRHPYQSHPHLRRFANTV